MTKAIEREQARALRREQGLSVKEICKALGVSKASVSVWVRDIELTPEQIARLHENKRVNYNQHLGAKGVRAKYLRLREQYQLDGRERARQGDPLHLTGCMLYWAEGTKKRDGLSFINSDADMVRTFVMFLRSSLYIATNAIRLRIICYDNNGASVEAIQSFWFNHLALNDSNLQSIIVNNQPSSSRQKGRKLIYGMAEVSVHDVRIVQHIYGAIQEYTGIDKPEWLG